MRSDVVTTSPINGWASVGLGDGSKQTLSCFGDVDEFCVLSRQWKEVVVFLDAAASRLATQVNVKCVK